MYRYQVIKCKHMIHMGIPKGMKGAPEEMSVGRE